MTELVGRSRHGVPGRIDAATRVGPVADAVLPVAAPLAELLPSAGLRRGTVVEINGGALLALALIAEASKAGAWCAVVGLPSLGVAAAAELGVALGRLALVPRPGPDTARVVATFLEGMDVVLVDGSCRLTAGEARRLTTRARGGGSVLIWLRSWTALNSFGGSSGGSDSSGGGFDSWPGADVRLAGMGGRWRGIGIGHGRLREREITVTATGRGAAARPRAARLILPTVTGGVAASDQTGAAVGGERLRRVG